MQASRKSTKRMHGIMSMLCIVGLLFSSLAMARGRFANSSSSESLRSSHRAGHRGFHHSPRDLQAVFDSMDENGDGVLSIEEFEGCDGDFDLLDVDPDDESLTFAEFEFAPVVLALDRMDVDGNGEIVAAEFLGYERRFDAIDEDNDRVLTVEELEATLDQLGRCHFGGHHPQRTIDCLDEDGDGAISLDEFNRSEEKFNSIDENGDELLTLEELENALVERKFDRMDDDEDGLISLEEFNGTDERFAVLDTEDPAGFVSAEELLKSFE